MSALSRLDRVLAIASWVAAAVLVVMLFAGPAVIANDEDKGASSGVYGGGAGGGGSTVFKANCGTCHTLSSAGTTGQVGPNLDGVSLSSSQIETVVRDGRGAMPSFGGKLSDGEVKAVAAFVAGSR